MRLRPSATLALLLGLGALAPTIAPAQIGVGISVGIAPPILPAYYQPRIPGYGYIWTPGYWAWDRGYRDYYWIPGQWVRPPRVGYLWTPAYWGWENGVYLFNAGYWGTSVGYYGGINYGNGYGGYGYGGGQWRGGQLYYNSAANNMSGFRSANVYHQAVAGGTGGRVSFNGGNGGVQAAPTAAEAAAAHQSRIAATPVQQSHIQAARAQPALRYQINHGAPAVAAVSRVAPRTAPASAAMGQEPRAQQPQRAQQPPGAMDTVARPTRQEAGQVVRQPNTQPTARQNEFRAGGQGQPQAESRGQAQGQGVPPRRPEPAQGAAPQRAERAPGGGAPGGGGQGGGQRDDGRKREGGPQ